MVEEWKEDIQKALVPVQLVMDCILLRLWASVFGNHTQYSPPDGPGSPSGPVVAGGPVLIPRMVSKKLGSKTPLIDTMVRRSPRINPATVDGYQMVKIKELAHKRRKKIGLQIDLDNPPSDASELINPIPMEVIMDWGVSCGVAPEELTEDVLMQGHGHNQEE